MWIYLTCSSKQNKNGSTGMARCLKKGVWRANGRQTRGISLQTCNKMFQESSIHVSGLQIGHSAILRPYPKRDDRRVELPLHHHSLLTFISSPRSSSQQHLEGAAPCIHDVYLCHDFICAMAVNIFIVRISCVFSASPAWGRAKLQGSDCSVARISVAWFSNT
jgi:hypothetical protein